MRSSVLGAHEGAPVTLGGARDTDGHPGVLRQRARRGDPRLFAHVRVAVASTGAAVGPWGPSLSCDISWFAVVRKDGPVHVGVRPAGV